MPATVSRDSANCSSVPISEECDGEEEEVEESAEEMILKVYAQCSGKQFCDVSMECSRSSLHVWHQCVNGENNF